MKIEREGDATFESLLHTLEENALQPLKYSLFKDFKHSRPGISTTFSQFVSFNSSKLSKFDMSCIVSNAQQLSAFSVIKLEGSEGREISSVQFGSESVFRKERPFKLEGRL
jgi:hypothetical protein